MTMTDSTVRGGSDQGCQHCTDCLRPAAHTVMDGSLPRQCCSTCLVAWHDQLIAAPRARADHAALLVQIGEALEPLRPIVIQADEDGLALTIEQMRAMHMYGWHSLDAVTVHEPDLIADVAMWTSAEAFYRERGGARSGEADYGVFHHFDHPTVRNSCTWRVSVVETTGDVYAAALCFCNDHARVILLGSVHPARTYNDADQRFTAWYESVGRDIIWFRARCGTPHLITHPPETAAFVLPGS